MRWEEIERHLVTMIGEAADRVQAMLTAAPGAVYLYCVRSHGTAWGKLLVLRENDIVPDGAEIVLPQPFRGAQTRDQVFAKIHQQARHLPLLPPER